MYTSYTNIISQHKSTLTFLHRRMRNHQPRNDEVEQKDWIDGKHFPAGRLTVAEENVRGCNCNNAKVLAFRFELMALNISPYVAQRNPTHVVSKRTKNSSFVCGASRMTLQTISAAATGVRQ